MKSFPEIVCVTPTLWLVLVVLLAGKGLAARTSVQRRKVSSNIGHILLVVVVAQNYFVNICM